MESGWGLGWRAHCVAFPKCWLVSLQPLLRLFCLMTIDHVHDISLLTVDVAGTWEGTESPNLSFGWRVEIA